VSPANTIVVRAGGAIDPSTLRDDALVVTGSASGRHPGRCRLADDGQTVVFTPDQAFALGEVVRVHGPGMIARRGGGALAPLEYTFTVSHTDPRMQPRVRFDVPDVPPPGAVATRSRPAAVDASDLPAGCPYVWIKKSNYPNSGVMALTPRSSTDIGPLMLIDNAGQPLFYRRFPTDACDFELQNGRLTYYVVGDAAWYALDSLYRVVDTWTAGNGYLADEHEFRLLPDGHALVLCYDTQIVAMDQIVPGGNPEAYVYGLVIQELDTERNVVFQWRSWDFFDITDGVDEDMTAPAIDYVHGNAIDVATDGNLLISSRNMNEITKIDRTSGAILWRFAPNGVHNDFTVIGDPHGFGFQHDVRQPMSGYLTLFDNDWVLNPANARGLMYHLDEEAMTATLVRDVRPSGGGAAYANGSTEWLPGGSMLVCWGAGPVNPQVSEYDAFDQPTLEYEFYPYMVSYRVRRFAWTGHALDTDRAAIDFGTVTSGRTGSDTLRVTNRCATDRTITQFVNNMPARFSVDLATPVTIPAGATLAVPMSFHADAPGASAATLYVRSSTANEVIACMVLLQGVAAGALGVPGERDATALALAPARPNPVRGSTTIPFSLARPGHATLRVYDAAGRRVATLLDADLPAGDHAARWDGRGADGVRRAPGVYVCELTAMGGRLERRVVLMR
jgi:hypothetical protein